MGTLTVLLDPFACKCRFMRLSNFIDRCSNGVRGRCPTMKFFQPKIPFSHDAGAEMTNVVLQTGAPWWLRRALLGTCFWMGHRRSLYREYPLGESAMVAELCNLLFANLPTNMKLVCEVQYSKLLDIQDEETEFTERSRVDLCVCGPLKKGEDPLGKVRYALEVKRGKASATAVNDDLRRLLELKKACPGVTVYLLLVSEGRRPTRFVTDKSFAIRKKLSIPETDGHCYVRAVMKAVPAVKSLDSAHYACAIEVVSNEG
jgi:hypothetical protein